MPRPVKLFLHHRYDGVESGPAEPCGAHDGRKLLRLQFIPFSYATPTFGDVVAAAKDPELDGHWAFEVPRPGGMDERHLHEHGGRYAMIVDYTLGGTHRGKWFPGRTDIVSSVAWHAEDEQPGRIYFAVPTAVSPRDVMHALADGHPHFRFRQIHPEPKKPRSPRAQRRAPKPAAPVQARRKPSTPKSPRRQPSTPKPARRKTSR